MVVNVDEKNQANLVDLTDAESQAYVDGWAESERSRQLDEEANGYKYAREITYPELKKEQLDKLYHVINNGTLDETGDFFTSLW